MRVLKGVINRAGLHRFIDDFMKLSSVIYFWYASVSIGSFALVTEKLGDGRPPVGG